MTHRANLMALKHLKPEFGERKLAEIDADQIERYFASGSVSETESALRAATASSASRSRLPSIRSFESCDGFSVSQ